jgi:hypothetical protein
MKKTAVKIIVNLYSIIFIGAGIAALCFRPRTFVAAFMLIWAGVSLLRRKAFGVYVVFFMALVLACIGLLFVGLTLYDMAHRLYKFEMLFVGLGFIIPSILSFLFFTRREVAESFSLSKVSILEKVDKKQLVGACQFLLVSGLAVGLVFLICYFIAMWIAH